MLASADAALAARDPAVPGLATALDPDALADRLRAALPRAGISGATATYVRYKPGTSCVVGYRLRSGGETVDAYAKAHRDDDAAKVAKALGRARATALWGAGAVELAEERLVVSFFPNDRRLRGAKRLAEPERRRAVLERLLPDRPDAWGGTLRALRYKPERRYVARLDGPDGPVAVLKCYADDDFARAERGSGAFTADPPLEVVPRLGASAAGRILAIAWRDGRPLHLALRRGCSAAALEAVGAALARLHGQDGGHLDALGREEEAVRLLAAARAIATASPELGDRARSLGVRLAAALLALPEVGVPIHGDFSADQVLLGDREIAILDYDSAVLGDPVADLGLFRANLLRDVLADEIDAGAADGHVEALLRGYRPPARGDPRAHLDLYTSVCLLRLGPEPFRYRLPDWPRRTAAILRRAAEVAAEVPRP